MPRPRRSSGEASATSESRRSKRPSPVFSLSAISMSRTVGPRSGSDSSFLPPDSIDVERRNSTGNSALRGLDVTVVVAGQVFVLRHFAILLSRLAGRPAFLQAQRLAAGGQPVRAADHALHALDVDLVHDLPVNLQLVVAQRHRQLARGRHAGHPAAPAALDALLDGRCRPRRARDRGQTLLGRSGRPAGPPPGSGSPTALPRANPLTNYELMSEGIRRGPRDQPCAAQWKLNLASEWESKCESSLERKADR